MSQIRRTLLLANNKTEPIDVNNYLTIVALGDNLTVTISTDGAEYCIDGSGNWKTLAADEETPPINFGQTISFKKIIEPNKSEIVGTFGISKACNLIGNCMSMVFGDEGYLNFSLENYDNCFREMFQNVGSYSNAIVEVSDDFLPATVLSERCYYAMFNESPLIKGPKLPAKILKRACYAFMFNLCICLETAPELPATDLAECCYEYFLRGTPIKQAPELPVETLKNYCYMAMFYQCKELETAPILPAKILVPGCYYQMFAKCEELNYIKMLATDVSAENCLFYWVYKVQSVGTFVKNEELTLDVVGTNGIPEGWTVINE